MSIGLPVKLNGINSCIEDLKFKIKKNLKFWKIILHKNINRLERKRERKGERLEISFALKLKNMRLILKSLLLQ